MNHRKMILRFALSHREPRARAKHRYKKTGKGGGKGRKTRLNRNQKSCQQCIPFHRGTCKKGDHCSYERQVDSDGQPIPVGPEVMQKYDEAAKRFNDNKAEAKAKPAPNGGVGVTASMIVL